MTTLPLPIQQAISALFGTGKALVRHSALEAAETLASIARMAARHDISPEEATDLVEAQREATLIAIQTSDGIPEVDKAVAFDVLKGLVIKAAGAAL